MPCTRDATWLGAHTTDARPRLSRLFELLDHLATDGFGNDIVSAGRRDFVRTISQNVLMTCRADGLLSSPALTRRNDQPEPFH